MTKRSDEAHCKKENLEEDLKATQLEEKKVKKKKEAAHGQAEEEKETAQEAKCSVKSA